VEEWSRANDMIINKKKSGILPLFKKFQASLTMDEFQGYPVVTSYKYLGVYIDDSLSMKFHLAHLQKKLCKFEKMVNILNWKKAPLMIRLTLWKVFAGQYFYYAGFAQLYEFGFCNKTVAR
jgi:hypothetical protein